MPQDELGWSPSLASPEILLSAACPLATPPSAYKTAHVAITAAIEGATRSRGI